MQSSKNFLTGRLIRGRKCYQITERGNDITGEDVFKLLFT